MHGIKPLRNKRPTPLETWHDVLRACSGNRHPVVFISATPSLLDGLENWIGGLERLSLTDSFDGSGTVAVITTGVTPQDFANYSECVAYMVDAGLVPIKDTFKSQPRAFTSGAIQGTDIAVQLASCGFADGMANLLHLTEGDIAALLKQAKIKTSMVALGEIANYASFRHTGTPLGLTFSVDVTLAGEPAGREPVQVASEADWDEYAALLAGKGLVGRKPSIGRRYAVEIIVLPNGHLHAPLCEVRHERFWHRTDWLVMQMNHDRHAELQAAVAHRIKKIAASLAGTGFRGSIAIEFCEDEFGSMFVDRLIPGLSAHSLLAHAVTSLHGGLPLHLLHVATCLGLDIALATDSVQSRYGLHDDWSLLAIRHPGSQTEMITRAPATGLYQMQGGHMELVRREAKWADAIGDTGYFLRLQNAGNYRAAGTLLGLLYIRGQALTKDGALTTEAAHWIAAFQIEYSGLPVSGSSLPASISTKRRETFL
jgi:hypothetical protein